MLSWDADALVPGAVSAVKIGVNLDLIMWPIRRPNFPWKICHDKAISVLNKI